MEVAVTNPKKPVFSSALVTGASRGLGRALAVELARRGTVVGLVARDRDALDRVARGIAAEGGIAHVLPADVGRDDAAELVAHAHGCLGAIDLVIHAAGTLGPPALVPLSETSTETFIEALRVNLAAPFRITRELLPGMVMRERGTLVFVSTDAAVEAYATWGAYGVSKAGLEHLGRVLAKELEGSGVRTVVVDPGEMETAMLRAAMPTADGATLRDPRDVAHALLGHLEHDDAAFLRFRLDAPTRGVAA